MALFPNYGRVPRCWWTKRYMLLTKKRNNKVADAKNRSIMSISLLHLLRGRYVCVDVYTPMPMPILSSPPIPYNLYSLHDRLHIIQISSNNTSPSTSISIFLRNNPPLLKNDIPCTLRIRPIQIHLLRIGDLDRILLTLAVAVAVVVEEYPVTSTVQEQVSGTGDDFEEAHSAECVASSAMLELRVEACKAVLPWLGCEGVSWTLPVCRLALLHC